MAGVAGFYFAWMASRRPAIGPARRFLVNGAYMLCGFLLVTALMHLPVFFYGDIADCFEFRLRYLTGYQGIEESGGALRRVSEALAPYWPFYTLALLLAIVAFRRGGLTRQASEDRRPGMCSPSRPARQNGGCDCDIMG